MSSLTEAEGRWVFEVHKTLMSRSDAWDRCVKSGAAAGIEQLWWSKDHTRTTWRWRTTSKEQSNARFRAYCEARRST